NNLIAAAERLQHQLAPAHRAFVRSARSLYLYAETRSDESSVHEALQTLSTAGLAGIARMLQALPMPRGFGSTTTMAGLTPKEVEILRHLGHFSSTKEIAASLGRSPHTVDWHIKAILKKLGCSSRREAIAFAREHGIV
ncbi:MAG: response regulator transcription factor, partial [Candidatus Eremiobacteraeota bacterium]|nr:response regulator transcription factor [Candidatus Eremiobacteraeota bacterium]